MALWLRFLLLTAIILFVDWYFFQAVSTVFKSVTGFKRTLLYGLYWGATAFCVSVALAPIVYPWGAWSKFAKVYVVSFALVLVFSKLIGVVFVLADDIIRLGRWTWGFAERFFAPKPLAAVAAQTQGISRLEFLSQIALVAAAVPFASFLYGMARGAFQFTVRRETLRLPNLPEAFDGFRIAHISDLHIGSFTSAEPLEKALAMLLAEKPDTIFFTGDLVNNEASETEPFMDALRRAQAPMGVFSSIGNHDYGDYVQWGSPEAKRQNFKRLQNVHGELGWTLLMNEHRVLEKDGATIAVLGVENWGASMNFPKRGDLARAYAGAEGHPVKLLLSHDPTHWDAQVRARYPDIDVTFSGHTHGAQFGVEIPGFRWSPVQYFYKQWAGLYQESNQYLYVNRGLGFIGYPGRVGILPEITMIELRKA